MNRQAAGAALTALTIGVATATADAAPAPRKYQNCKALNKVYPHGVGIAGARDDSEEEPVRNFAVDAKVYRLNGSRLDRDKDKIVCEKL